VRQHAVPRAARCATAAPNSRAAAGQSVDGEARAAGGVPVANAADTVNGTPSLTTPTPPYRFTYRFPKTAAGQTFTFSATAIDPSANSTSASTSIQVISDDPPSVTLIPPATLVSAVPTTVSAQAADDVAISFVSFYVTPS